MWINPETGQLGVRVVYTGAPRSGKTETIQGLAECLFRSDDSPEVISPDQINGRTLYFDWLDYSGGTYNGQPIACQILSVPGQSGLAARRQKILAMADALVLVLDARWKFLGDATPFIQELSELARQVSPVPLIIQANKQDLKGCTPLPDLKRHLALDDSVECISASALARQNIRQIFVTSVGNAVRRATNLLHDADNIRTDITPETLLYEILDNEGMPELAGRLLKERGTCTPDATLQDVTAPSQSSEPRHYYGHHQPSLEALKHWLKNKITPASNSVPYSVIEDHWEIRGELEPSGFEVASRRIRGFQECLEQHPGAITQTRCWAITEESEGWVIWEICERQVSLLDLVQDNASNATERSIALRLISATIRLEQFRASCNLPLPYTCGLGSLVTDGRQVCYGSLLLTGNQQDLSLPDILKMDLSALIKNKNIQGLGLLNELRKLRLQMASFTKVIDVLSGALIELIS